MNWIDILRQIVPADNPEKVEAVLALMMKEEITYFLNASVNKCLEIFKVEVSAEYDDVLRTTVAVRGKLNHELGERLFKKSAEMGGVLMGGVEVAMGLDAEGKKHVVVTGEAVRPIKASQGGEVQP